MDIYKDAIDVQNACNLSGVLRSWVASLDVIRAEGTNGTDAFNTHAVNVLFADKVYSLAGYGANFSAAYATATAKQGSAQS